MSGFTNQIIPINATNSPAMIESGKGSGGTSSFLCPPNTVITGRWHESDENGATEYRYCSLLAGALICTYQEKRASDPIEESGKSSSGTSSFICPQDYVIVGRQHDGDENGTTQYHYAKLFFNEGALVTRNPVWSDWFEESGKSQGGTAEFQCPQNTVITGREHSGDENGQTRYQYSELYLDDGMSSYRALTTDAYASNPVEESAGVWVDAPQYKVLTGRQHSGDENGQTRYFFQYVYLDFPGNEVETIDPQFSGWFEESGKSTGGTAGFQCPANTVITGREHSGDENGQTRYQYSYIRYAKLPNPCAVTVAGTSPSIVESSGTWSVAPANAVMTGRSHSGDENGDTTYTYSQIQLTAMPLPSGSTDKWMTGLPNDLLLSEINIPGTHDSAAINEYVSTPWATQTLPITAQLNAGVRMLDVRIRVESIPGGGFDFYTCHGDIGSTLQLNRFQSLKSLFDEVQAFLKVSQDETVLVSLKIDDWTDVAPSESAAVFAALAQFLAPYPTVAPAAMPSLRDLRGNILLLNRINQSYDLGTPMGWHDNTNGEYDTYSNGRGGNIRKFNIFVQDQYEGLSPDQKLKLFQDTWEQKSTGALLLNFASGVTGLILGVYINEALMKGLGKVEGDVRRHIVGISLFDNAASSYPLKSGGEINCVSLTVQSNHADYGEYRNVYELIDFKGL